MGQWEIIGCRLSRKTALVETLTRAVPTTNMGQLFGCGFLRAGLVAMVRHHGSATWIAGSVSI
jgi:hypothetical protein